METAERTKVDFLEFENGDQMPALGLGTWKSKPGEVRTAVYEAIKIGYRHIDCADSYDNQNEVGEGIEKAISEGIVKRKDLFITSKLWNSDHEKDQVMPALKKILADLRLKYLDLFLVHWPVAQKKGVKLPEKREDFLSWEEAPLEETWKAMEEAKENGLAKHIGVSNFNADNLGKLIDSAKVWPEMNQIEVHPYLQQQELIRFCNDRGIHITAYSPLGSTDRPEQMKKDDEPVLFENETIKKIADKHGCSPAQVLIAWALNRGTAVIPKSTTTEHIKSNFEARNIELDDEDKNQLMKLDRGYRFVDGSFFATEKSPYSLEDIW